MKLFTHFLALLIGALVLIAFPLASCAQIPEGAELTSELPPYYAGWTAVTPATDLSSDVFVHEENINFFINQFVQAVDETGEVLLPVATRGEVATASAPASTFDAILPLRPYKLIDRWTATVFDGGGTNNYITADVMTFMGADWYIACAVVTPTGFMVVIPYDDGRGTGQKATLAIVGQTGSQTVFGSFIEQNYSFWQNQLGLTPPASSPMPAFTECIDLDIPEAANAPAPMTAAIPDFTVQDVRVLNTSISTSPGVDLMVDGIPYNFTNAHWACAYTGLANGITLPELGVLFRLQMTRQLSGTNGSGVLMNPDTASSFWTVWNGFNPDLVAQEAFLQSTGATDLFPGVDLGQHFTMGGGGVASGSAACSSFKYNGMSRIGGPFDMWRVRSYVHECGHQLSATHNFNANENTRADFSATQREPTSAFEPGSGVTIMSYPHNCKEFYSQTGADGTLDTILVRHNVTSLMRDRIQLSRFHKNFPSTRYRFHSFAVESIRDFLDNTCATETSIPSISPGLNIQYEWGTESANSGSTLFVPTGKAFVLSAAPQFNTSFRWQQMDLGPFHTFTDTLAINTPTGQTRPQFLAEQPYDDGKRFFPPRDVLFDENTIDYQYSPLPAGAVTFRVQANRFTPTAELGATAAEGSIYYHSIVAEDEITVQSIGNGSNFDWKNIPFSTSSNFTNIYATQEIGEEFPAWQATWEWWVGGTDNPPFSATTVEVVLVTETDDLQFEVLSSSMPNTGTSGSFATELPPTVPLPNGDIPTQRLLIRPQGEIFFLLSPRFKVIFEGCKLPQASNYAPLANVENNTLCTYSLPDITPSSYCKDLDACNYSEFAPYHRPSGCKYPTCNSPAALNQTTYANYDFLGEPACEGGLCVTESTDCSGQWLDPDDNTRGWGFNSFFAKGDWSIDYWPSEMWMEFDSDYPAQLKVFEKAGRLHFTAGSDVPGISTEHNALVQVPNNGWYAFDWQITEAAATGYSNLSFWLDGEAIDFNPGPSYNNTWQQGDEQAPHQGTAYFYAFAGQTFKVSLATDLPSQTPIGVVLSDFTFDVYDITGCQTLGAINFNPIANCHDESMCTYATDFGADEGCFDMAACNYELPLPGVYHNPDLCTYAGCQNEGAANFSPSAGCAGPCCFTGDCDFAEDALGQGSVLWDDYNWVWEEVNPLPDFTEVMFAPGGMVLTAPQTTMPGVSQAVTYTYSGTSAQPMSFLFKWLPGDMLVPTGTPQSPAGMEVWKDGVLVQEVVLDDSAGDQLFPNTMQGMQAYAIPPSQWPGDPFGLNPNIPGVGMLTSSEPLPSVDMAYRKLDLMLTEGTTIVLKINADVMDYVVDESPCKLLITAMSLPQNESCNLLSGEVAIGCTDATACNYDALATADDGSCIPVGCTDPSALNFNPAAGCQSTCLYPGTCGNAVTVDETIAFGFQGPFHISEASVEVPDGLLQTLGQSIVIIGPDQANGAVANSATDYGLEWVITEDITIQFAYAVASWDSGITYDVPYYSINGGEEIQLNDVNGDDPSTAYFMVEDESWIPAMDLALPDVNAVVYPGFVDNMLHPIKVLKTPIQASAGDTLRIGVHSLDSTYGPVVLAIGGMTWTNHCGTSLEDLVFDGCTDGSACNFNPYATGDDGSCTYPSFPCDDGNACTYNDTLTPTCACEGTVQDADNDGTCDAEDGCPDNPDLTEEGVCGCSTPTDINGDGVYDCFQECGFDTDGDGICDEFEIGGCTDSIACNYNVAATDDDGSCAYTGEACACSFEIPFDTGDLPGGESIVTTWTGGFSSGVETVDVTLDFTSLSGNYAYDLRFAICDPNGTCAEFGGFDLSFGYIDLGSLPVSWNTSASGTYTATIDLTPAGFTGDGVWAFEFLNSYTGSGALGNWAGALTLNGNCGPEDYVLEGCTSETACNYNPQATQDNGSCTYPGCTQASACNYDSQAGCDDGSCQASGCTDESACNFEPFAACDDGSCSHEEGAFDLSEGLGIWMSQVDPVLCEAGFNGQMSIQFNPDGTFSYINAYAILFPDDPGTNPYTWDEVLGVWSMCGNEVLMTITEPSYTIIYIDSTFHTTNTAVGATWELTFTNDGQPNLTGGTYLPDGTLETCVNLLYMQPGCMNETACNYNPNATLEDTSCTFPGCTDEFACNFDPWAGCDDGNCQPLSEPVVDIAQGIWNYQGTGGADCLHWGGGGDFQFNPDGTVSAGPVAPTHPAYGLGQVIGNWALCGSDFYMALTDSLAVYDYETGEFVIWSDYTGFIFEGTFAFGNSTAVPDYGAGGPLPLISGTAQSSNGYAWCFEFLAAIEGCSDETALNYNPMTSVEGCCIHELSNAPGCTDPNAINFNYLASDDDGSCIYDPNSFGCTDANACNFNANATIPDDSCEYDSCLLECMNTWVFDAGVLPGSNYAEYTMVVEPGAVLDSVVAEVQMVSSQGGTIWNYMMSVCDPQGTCVQLGGMFVSLGYENEIDWVDMPSYYSDTTGVFVADVSGLGLAGAGEWTIQIWHGVPWNNQSAAIQGNFTLVGACGDPNSYVTGCIDPNALNYDPEAELENGSCLPPIEGCTDPTALNYNPAATISLETCVYTEAQYYGCTYPEACNYAAIAVEDDGSCLWPEDCEDCTGACLDADQNGICDCYGDGPVAGCTDPTALNYNPFATEEGPCEYQIIQGCMDAEACNYDPGAEDDQYSLCFYPSQPYLDCAGGCLNDADGDGVCDELEIIGCLIPSALNWNPYATDEGSCTFQLIQGCMDPTACNFDPSAEEDMYSLCFYPSQSFLNCAGECINDADGDGVCDELEIVGCTEVWALNFHPFATDEGDCFYQILQGCMDPVACNYDPAAQDNTYSLCFYPSQPYLDCEGACLNDVDGDGVCDELEIAGCDDYNALNWNGLSTDPGPCEYPANHGCMDAEACNFDPYADTDEFGLCVYPSQSFLDCEGACLNDADGDNVCDEMEVAGCTSEAALNFNAFATDDDGSCLTQEDAGCTYPDAENYDAEALVDDGSCAFAAANNCPSDLDGSGVVSIADLLLLLSDYGTNCP